MSAQVDAEVSKATEALEASHVGSRTEAAEDRPSPGAAASPASSPPASFKSTASTPSSRDGMSRTATLRLMSDLRAITEDSPDGISAALVDDSDVYEWQATIIGPEETAFEGGIYGLRITFDGEYPNKPPRMKFTCDMWHPNIYMDGAICMDVLKALWKPIYTVPMILQSIQSLLADPNPLSAANPDAAAMLEKDPKAYRRRVRKCAERSLEMGFDD